MAISHQATSYLNPSQNAAEEAAREASTGNVALGNSSIENSTVLTKQFAQGTSAPSFTYGAPQVRTISESGAQTTSYPEAAYDQLPNSSYPFTPSLGRDFSSRLSTMASDYHAKSEANAQIASQSTTSSIAQFRELRDQTNSGKTFETASGASTSDSVQTAFSEVDQASLSLQRQFGLSRRAADDISTAWFIGGEASAEAGLSAGVASGKVGVKGGGTRTWTDSDIGIASEDRSKIFGSLRQISETRNWSSTRDGFMRTVSTSSDSRVRSTASGLNASLTETKTATLEARRSDEVGQRLEQQASYYSGSNAAGNLNLSQAYREWGMAEIENNRDYYGDVRFDDTTFQLSPKGQALQRKFVESYAGGIKSEVESELVPPQGSAISRPAVTTQAGIRATAPLGAVPAVPGLPAAPDPSTVHDEVARQQNAGRQQIDAQRNGLGRLTDPAKGASAEAADDVKEW